MTPPLNRLLLLIAFVLSHGYPSSAQGNLTLENCIQLALDRNLGVKRQSLQVDLAKDKLQTSQAARLPGLEGFYSHNLSSGKTVNYEDYTYINTTYQDGNVGIQGTLPVFSGFSNWYLTKASKYAYLSESEKRKELEKSVTLEVTTAFLRILYCEELLAVAEAKLAATEEQLRMNEGFFNAGRMSKVEVLTLKSQVAQDNLSRIQAENDLKSAYLSLAQLLNLESASSLSIQRPASLEGPLTLDILDPTKVYDFALSNHPGISSAELILKSREAGLAAMRAQISPSIALNGLVYSRYSELGVNPLNPTAVYPYSLQLKDNMFSRATVNVSIPLFNQLQQRSRINQARIQTDDARLMLEEKKLAVRKDIQLAYTDALNARAKYQATGEAVLSATESFNLTQEKYKNGLASSVEFKVAQNQLVQSQLTQIQTKYEYIIRAKILDLYLNKPISIE